jgi:hypothetical protein
MKKQKQVDLTVLSREEQAVEVMKYALARLQSAEGAGGNEDPFITPEQFERKFKGEWRGVVNRLVRNGDLCVGDELVYHPFRSIEQRFEALARTTLIKAEKIDCPKDRYRRGLRIIIETLEEAWEAAE